MPHLPDHRNHDQSLIAAHAAGDAEGADLERARDLVAACDECAELQRDLRAISTALPLTPAPTRPRDFRLTPEQADALRPAGWRRLLAPLAGPRFAFAAPLGGSLAALGIAGILVAGAASTPVANVAGQRQSASSPVAEVPGGTLRAAEPAPASQVDELAMPAASVDPAGAQPGMVDTGPAASAAASDGYAYGGAVSTKDVAEPSEAASDSAAAVAAAPEGGQPPVLAILSVALLAVGLVLVGLRISGRRTGASG